MSSSKSRFALEDRIKSFLVAANSKIGQAERICVVATVQSRSSRCASGLYYSWPELLGHRAPDTVHHDHMPLYTQLHKEAPVVQGDCAMIAES